MTYKIPCERCNGEGKISHFTHVDGGLCFKCNGTKFQEVTEIEFKTWESNEIIKKDVAKAKRKELMEQAIVNYLSNYDLVAVREVGEVDTFNTKLLTHEGIRYVKVNGGNRKVVAVFGKVNKRVRVEYFVKCFEMLPFDNDFSKEVENKPLQKWINNFKEQLKLDIKDRAFEMTDEEIYEKIESLTSQMK